MNKNHRKSLLVIAGVVVLATAVAAYMPGFLPEVFVWKKSFTKSVKKGGYFFRVKVKLTLASNDEPVDFDVIVACAVKFTNYRDGDRSFFATMAPELFMQRVRGNHGVMLKLPRLCQRQTTKNGRVPADFLPGILWFKDADDWLRATGYFTELAYENPNSKLKFHGATVQAVSRADWEEWRKTEEPKNLIPAYLPPTRGTAKKIAEKRNKTWTLQRIAHEWRGPVQFCTGAQRFRMPEGMRKVARQYWPANRPRYWSATIDQYKKIRKQFEILGPDYGKTRLLLGPLINGIPLSNYMWRSSPNGYPTRSGGGRATASRIRYPAPEIFPMRHVYQEDVALKTPEEISRLDIVKNFDMRNGSTNGFLYCYTAGYQVVDPLETKRLKDSARCTVDGKPIQRDLSCWNMYPGSFFEKDEYFYRIVEY